MNLRPHEMTPAARRTAVTEKLGTFAVKAVAKRDIKCAAGFCGRKTIKKGERCDLYRERAASSREACHRGLYPTKVRCEACARRDYFNKLAYMLDTPSIWE